MLRNGVNNIHKIFLDKLTSNYLKNAVLFSVSQWIFQSFFLISLSAFYSQMTWNTIALCQYFLFFSPFQCRAHFGPVWILDIHAAMPPILMHSHPIKTLIIEAYGFTSEIHWTWALVLIISELQLDTFKMCSINLSLQNWIHSWNVCMREDSYWWVTLCGKPSPWWGGQHMSS